MSERLREHHWDTAETHYQRMCDEDPLNQCSRRVRRRFEEAMEGRTNELADDMQNLSIQGDPRPVRGFPNWFPPHDPTRHVEEVD